MIPLTVVAQTHLPAVKPTEAATGLRSNWAGQEYYDWERSRAESDRPGVADLAAQACRQLLLGANKPDDIGAIVQMDRRPVMHSQSTWTAQVGLLNELPDAFSVNPFRQLLASALQVVCVDRR